MARGKNYTQEEEQIITDEISNSAYNIQQACRNAAKRIGRTPKAIEQHWYKVTSKSETCYLLIGKRNKTKNRKVIVDNSGTITHSSSSIWKKILKLFGIK